MTPPSQISHYKIISKLGEGGMGAVYRATDTRLNRDVAIKVLPAAFAEDAGRMQRFEREAQALASLNHPNIAAIYGIEQGAIIMELVEGTDLAGPLPVDTAVAYAKQIAEALEAAHEKGIVHRDLKPANIKVTPEGVVKLLDFGLAKMGEDAAQSRSGSATISPTLSLEATRAGMILGTAGYMSPEQASGKPVDKRADIWSFGVVLFEMLTGRRLFGGETVSHTLADVLRAPVDLDELPAGTPAKLRELIRRCLDRNVRTRLRDIGEARILLGEPLTEPALSVPAAAQRAGSRRLWGLAAVLAMAIPAAWFLKPAPEAPLLQLEVAPPLGVTMGPPGFGQVQVSPDGTMLVFAGQDRDGIEKLWLRPLSAGVSTAIPGTENAKLPYWSPDSRQLVFYADNQLKRVELATFRMSKVCDVSGEPWTVWTSRGLLLFSNADRAIAKVPAGGGAPIPVFSTSVFPAGVGHTPQALPDGQHFLVQRAASPSKLVFASVDGQVIRTWETNAGPASPGAPTRFAAAPNQGGWLLSHRPDNRLVAHSFNPRTGELSGDEIPIAQDVPQGPSWSTSDNGVLAYRSLRGFNAVRKLTWVDRAGARGESIGEPGDVYHPRISHDQKNVVYTRDTGNHPLLFIYDSVRKTTNRLTLATTANAEAEWLPDDSGVVYASGSPMGSALAVHRLGAASDKPLAFPQGYLSVAPTGISHDGKRMAGANLFTGANRVVILSLEPDRTVSQQEYPLHTID
ncbi:MAG TPA: protein kinase, partial [Bryobacteraceae bacterium]